MVVETSTRTVSPDGQTLTIMTNGTNAGNRIQQHPGLHAREALGQPRSARQLDLKRRRQDRCGCCDRRRGRRPLRGGGSRNSATSIKRSARRRPGSSSASTDGYHALRDRRPAPTAASSCWPPASACRTYIWDPTFAALVARRLPRAALRLLRPRLLRPAGHRLHAGRSTSGSSAELLDALHITQPIDLAGLSFGGSVVTSFADRYPGSRPLAGLRRPVVLEPYAVPVVERMPSVWNYLDRHFRGAVVGRHAAGRFSAPGALSRLARSLRGADAVPRLPPRPALDQPSHNADVDQAPQLKRVGEHPRPVLVVLGQGGPVGPLRVQRDAAGGDAPRPPGPGRSGGAPAALGTARRRPPGADRVPANRVARDAAGCEAAARVDGCGEADAGEGQLIATQHSAVWAARGGADRALLRPGARCVPRGRWRPRIRCRRAWRPGVLVAGRRPCRSPTAVSAPTTCCRTSCSFST